jgi:hypothetical protein
MLTSFKNVVYLDNYKNFLGQLWLNVWVMKIKFKSRGWIRPAILAVFNHSCLDGVMPKHVAQV